MSTRNVPSRSLSIRRDRSASRFRASLLVVGLAAILGFAGCQSSTPPPAAPAAASSADPKAPLKLIEGDVLSITFPGAPNLDTQQQIRRDGRIALQLVGEIEAVGKTPAQLEAEIAKLIASQVVSNQVSVTVVSSTYPVFVTGAVVRPGKIESDRPLTVLEAVLEAGGPDYTRANLVAVTITRTEDGVAKHYTVNLKAVLEGKDSSTFYLKPSDIVFVPERFSWF